MAPRSGVSQLQVLAVGLAFAAGGELDAASVGEGCFARHKSGRAEGGSHSHTDESVGDCMRVGGGLVDNVVQKAVFHKMLGPDRLSEQATQ